MKFNVLRSLILPWLIFFIFALSLAIFAHVQWNMDVTKESLFLGYLGLSSLLCLIINARTIRMTGIWMAYSLPLSLKFSSTSWMLRIVGAIIIAGAVLQVGHLRSMPLAWSGIVTPFLLALCLYVVVRSLLGLILKNCANMTLGRTLAFIMSAPVLLSTPFLVLFLTKTVTFAYDQSRAMPDIALLEAIEPKEGPAAAAPTSSEIKAEELAQLVRLKEDAVACADARVFITNQLVASQPEVQVIEAIPLIPCSGIKPIVSLQRLLDLMMNHPSARVRTAAIKALPKYSTDSVKRVAYLLLRKVSETESDEVIAAATQVLLPTGDVERSLIKVRLKRMMANPLKSGVASRILIRDFGLEMDVKEIMRAEFNDTSKTPLQAISMLCSLKPADLEEFQPQIQRVLAAAEANPKEEVILKAIDCLGESARKAVQVELSQPRTLTKLTATRILERFELPFDEAFALLLRQCARDASAEVRASCSKNLARMGSPALPTIVDLLRSGNPLAKESGRKALESLRDPKVKEELLRIGRENSGWLANQEKLEVARAARLALKQLESQKSEIK